MNLYLVRHAEALSGSENASRPLSPAGMADAERVAQLLTRAGLARPSEIRHSTKLRARQTAGYFARAWGGIPEHEVAGLESEDDPRALVPALAEAPGDLVLVGHLPHLPRLAALLLAGDAALDLIDLPPAGALCLLRTGGAQPSWCLRWMITPRLLSSPA